MDVTGIAIMRAAPDQVWAALTDPAVLAAAIPGCEWMERSGPDAYRFTIIAGIGPLHGRYNGRVAISDQDEPRSFVLTASGAGGAGTVRIRARFGLAAFAGGDTELTYTADGEIAGLLASAGQRMITAVAQRMAAEFFRSVDAQLQPGNGAGAADSDSGLAAAVVPSPRLSATATSVRPGGADSSGADSSGADSNGADSSGADSSGADSSGADSNGADSGRTEFLAGAFTGTVAALAGVALGSLLRRRKS